MRLMTYEDLKARLARADALEAEVAAMKATQAEMSSSLAELRRGLGLSQESLA